MSRNKTNHLQAASQRSNIGRRKFIQTSSLSLIACGVGQPDTSFASTALTPDEKDKMPPRFFRLDETYTDEQLRTLYKKSGNLVDLSTSTTRIGDTRTASVDTARNTRDRDEVDRQHMIFYYDQAANMLVNPFNVPPVLKAGKYNLNATILNYHVSKMDYHALWSKFKDDAQLQLGLTTPTLDNDDLTWTLMNGIDVFLGGKAEGIDGRLKRFLDNNTPTSKFRPSERIEILSGSGKLQVQIFGQKKKSFWRQLLSMSGTVVNSPIFGTLPIPRLLPQGLQFANTVLDRIQVTDKLAAIWTSGRISFRLYDGASGGPFTLRPGYWLTIDRSFAARNLDANQNLKDHYINIPGQFFELVNSSNQPVDANYTVLEFSFPTIT